MDCRLTLPDEIKGLLSAGFYSEQTKSSALEDFLDHEKDQFYESLDDYRRLNGAIVDDSLTVEGVELEGNGGTVSLSFYEEERSGCKDRDKPAEPNFVDIRFDLTTDKIILHFIDNSRLDEPEL